MENEKKYKCDKCDGKGYIDAPSQLETIEVSHLGAKSWFPGRTNTLSCSKCHGEGELDWVENIRGKIYSIKMLN